jgi:hypothetical protein
MQLIPRVGQSGLQPRRRLELHEAYTRRLTGGFVFGQPDRDYTRAGSVLEERLEFLFSDVEGEVAHEGRGGGGVGPALVGGEEAEEGGLQRHGNEGESVSQQWQAIVHEHTRAAQRHGSTGDRHGSSLVGGEEAEERGLRRGGARESGRKR